MIDRPDHIFILNILNKMKSDSYLHCIHVHMINKKKKEQEIWTLRVGMAQIVNVMI